MGRIWCTLLNIHFTWERLIIYIIRDKPTKLKVKVLFIIYPIIILTKVWSLSSYPFTSSPIWSLQLLSLSLSLAARGDGRRHLWGGRGRGGLKTWSSLWHWRGWMKKKEVGSEIYRVSHVELRADYCHLNRRRMIAQSIHHRWFKNNTNPFTHIFIPNTRWKYFSSAEWVVIKSISNGRP